MKDQLKTIREFIESVHEGEWAPYAGRYEALTALSELERMAGEPVAWKHDCAALLANDVELWIDNCPHCGRPRAAPPAQQPQIVGEVLPRWDTEKERVDGVRAHMHKELPIDTKLYAYLPAESKPLFPSGAPEAIEKARNLGMDLS